MARIRTTVASAALVALLGGAPLAAADDTEVFFAKAATAEHRAANVLFMFDISGSMGDYDGTPYRRITRLKQAMMEILDSVEGVNVGIGAFNGSQRGGAILQPAIDPDRDLCPNAACTELSLRVPLHGDGNDVEWHPEDAQDADLDLTGVPGEGRGVGLRFTGVDIPRGATIRHAVIEFVADDSDEDEATSITIRAEKSGDAPVFATDGSDPAARVPTDAEVLWTPGPWWLGGIEEQTADIASVVQEVVDRDDWCGGNAMAFLLEGTGERDARSHETDPWDAPVLKISYDPSTIDFSTSCLSRRSVSAVGRDVDDGAEKLSNGVVTLDTTTLAPGDGSAHRVGLRFGGVDVPRGASISSAYLELVVDSSSGNASNLSIRVEPSAHAAPFGTAAYGIGARTSAASSVAWSSVPDAQPGERIVSPDIGALIAPRVADGGWNAGNAIVVTLDGDLEERVFRAFDGGATSAARLEINYRVEGAAGATAPLRTAREELRDIVLGFRDRAGTPLVDAYYESALYMLGEPVHYGRQRGEKSVWDRYYRLSHPDSYSGGTLYTPPSCDEVDPNAYACVTEELTGEARYDAPIAGACQANQIVLLSDGAATTGNSSSLIRSLTGLDACATRGNTREVCAIELADWLHEGDSSTGRKSLITHTIGFNFSSSFLEEVATAGGGRFQTAGSADELAGVFRTILDEAADVDTSFVAPTTTVSQFNRLTNRDDVYFAMFKPSLEVRWPGNLKRYGLNKAPGSDEVVLVDALGLPLVDAYTGRIRDDARSYWLDGAVPDGPRVAAGGAANEIVLARDLYTYVYADGAPSGLLALHEDTAEIGTALLGVGDETERETLLRWARGVDVRDVDADGDVTEVRHEMGDPLHTTPFILNYPPSGPDDTNGRSIVFLGTNEGFLHAIDTDDGSEVFGFMPPELLPNLERRYGGGSVLDRRYGLDGPVGGWFDDRNGNLVVDADEKALIYFGMRRGGRNYYALDVSDPDNPSLAWVVRGGAGDFAELGQSWSHPTFTRVLHEGEERGALVFGGGYDPINDTRETRAAGVGDESGRAIFVVDVETGGLIARLDGTSFPDMDYAVPSDVKLVDVDLDGFVDMLWVGDMGGRLWRFDIAPGASGTLASRISGTVVADLASSSTVDNRRFHYPPDVALVRDDEGEIFMNVAIGSGWRAHPLDVTVEDRFYVLRVDDFYGPPRDVDGAIDYPTRLVESDLYDVTEGSVRDDASGRSATGWYLTFGASGEKVLGRSLTVDRQILFTTYVPPVDAIGDCEVSIGGGRFYALDAVYGDGVLEPDESVEEGAEEEPAERAVSLKNPGIPPPVNVMIPTVDASTTSEPIGLVGLEKIEKLQFGPSRRRTYWVER